MMFVFDNVHTECLIFDIYCGSTVFINSEYLYLYHYNVSLTRVVGISTSCRDMVSLHTTQSENP